MNKIYLDNAATTPVSDEVFQAMLPFLKEQYGNPSSIYETARISKKAIDKARKQVAALIGAEPREIFFTSGGTEADNWAIRSMAEMKKVKGNHIITSAIEHHAVLHTCKYLEKNGYRVTYLPVDEDGFIQISDLKEAITPETILITIMYANNEIGTIQPVQEIGRIAKENGIAFHTDAVQAVGHIPINVKELDVDMLSLSGHKIYGPKGIGALYVRKGIKLVPFMHGGAQESNRRAGTENLAGIVGLGEAAKICSEELRPEMERLADLRDRLIQGITSTIPHCWLNGSSTHRLPGNVNISFEFIEGESILLYLDMQGIAASSGSACTSGSLDPSHVLLAIGLPHAKAHGSLRLTLGRYNTEADVDAVIKALPVIIDRLRQMSPLYEEFLAGKQSAK